MPPKQFDWNSVITFMEEKGTKPQSVNTQLGQMRRVLRGVFGEKSPTLAQVKKSIPQVLEWIKAEGNLPNHAQRKNAMVSMYQFYQSLGVPTKRMEKPFKEIVEMSQAERLNGLSEKNQAKFDKVDFSNIKEKIEEEENPTNRLLKAIYSGDMPILRGEEWRGLAVVTKKKPKQSELPKNYLSIPTNTLHIRDAKSLGGAEHKVVDVPDSIMSEVRRYLQAQGGDKLFPDMSASVMTKRLNKLLGYSIQALRKRYVSEKVKEGLSNAERIKLASLMGHTIMTQVTDYVKDIDE